MAGPSMNGLTPVQRERLCGDRRRIVVADRPGAARTAGGYAGEHRLTGAATWAWAWHDLPAGAVPAHDQRPADGAVGVSADRPRIAILRGGHPGQDVDVRWPADRIWAGHDGPAGARPTLDQSSVGRAVGDISDGPDVARGGGGHGVQHVVLSGWARVGAGHTAPSGAGPVHGQRPVGPALLEVVADRPDVGG